MRRFGSIIVVMLAITLGGCVGAAMEGARTTADVARRDNLMPKAEAGDPVAQFKVGESYCCNTGGVSGAYDNQKATEWLCKSAYQGYGPAQYKLGRIYSGDLVDGVRLFRRVAVAAFGPDSDLTLSEMWFTLAASQNVEGAAKKRDSIAEKLTPQQRATAAQLTQSWRTAPCTWNQVYGS
jgi:TPR repeat protein